MNKIIIVFLFIVATIAFGDIVVISEKLHFVNHETNEIFKLERPCKGKFDYFTPNIVGMFCDQKYRTYSVNPKNGELSEIEGPNGERITVPQANIRKY